MEPPVGPPPPSGDIVFTDEELAELSVVVLGGPPIRRVRQGGAELSAGGEVLASQRPTVRQPAFSPLDVLVEAAFAREVGKVSWRGAAAQRVEEDGIEPVALATPELDPGEPLSEPPRERAVPPPSPRLAHPDRATRPLPPLPPEALAASRGAAARPLGSPDSGPSRRSGPPPLGPNFPGAGSRSTPSLPSFTPPPSMADGGRPRPGPPSIPPQALGDEASRRGGAPAALGAGPPGPSAAPVVPPLPPMPSSAQAVPPPLPLAVLSTMPPPPLPLPSPAVSPAMSPPLPSLPPVAAAQPAIKPSVPPLPLHLAPGASPGVSPGASIDPRDPSRDRRGAPSLPPTVPALPVGEPRRALPTSPPPPAAPPPAPAEARLRSLPAEALDEELPESPPPRPLLVREAASRPSLDDAVFSSSAPPDHEVLRFTVPEPTTFRVVVGPFTPHLEGRAGSQAPRPAPARPASVPVRPPRVELLRGEIHPHDRDEDLDGEPMESMESEALEELPAGASPGPDEGAAALRDPEGGPRLSTASTTTLPPPRAPAPPADGAAPEMRGRRRRRSKPWFEELFDEDFLRTLPPVAPAQTEREARFLLDALRISGPAALLDIGCGVGRHAVELAARGHDVTGIDLSLPLLIRAADTARRAGVNVNFIHGDMRDMAFEGQFDAAFCWYSTFGYFDDETNRAVAAQIHRALKPSGRLLLDITNRDFLLSEVPARFWWQGDGCMVLEELDFNHYTSRLQNHRSVVFEDGRQLEFEVSIRAYSLHEVGKLLHAAGFRVLEVSGSPHTRGRFFGAASRQILVVAEKK